MALAIHDPDVSWMFLMEEQGKSKNSSSVQDRDIADPVVDTVLACTNWLDAQWKALMDEQKQQEHKPEQQEKVDQRDEEQHQQNPVAEAITAFMTWLDTDDPDWDMFQHANQGDMQHTRKEPQLLQHAQQHLEKLRQNQQQLRCESKQFANRLLSQLPENEELSSSILPSDASLPERDERYDPPGLATQLSSIWVSPVKSELEPLTHRKRCQRQQLQRRVGLWSSMNSSLAKNTFADAKSLSLSGHRLGDCGSRRGSPPSSAGYSARARRRMARQRRGEHCGKLSMRAFMAVAQECTSTRSHSLPAKLAAKLPPNPSRPQGGTPRDVSSSAL